jgi:hypothetical protein
MDTKTTHIIFSGCSFSDDGSQEDVYDIKTIRENNFSLKSFRYPTTIKLHTFFAFDLINQNKSNIKIHTLARGSFGNHVIADKFIKKVNEIKIQFPNDEIVGVIQFSALVRRGLKTTGFDVDLNQYPFDYMTYDEKNNYSDIKIIFEKHIDNIINLKSFCKNNNIKNFMFFGWANFFKEDVVEVDISDKMVELEKIVNFVKYNDSIDEMQYYCAGKKPTNIEENDEFCGIKLYQSKSDDYGGLIEYSRDRLPIGKRYYLPTDPHPSTNAYYIYYTEILKKWFIDINILNDIEFTPKQLDILNHIFEFEFIRFKITNNSKQTENEKISQLSYDIIDNNKLCDIDYIENVFKKYRL